MSNQNQNKILVACDIDGTILNSNHQLDQETIDTFKIIQKNFSHVILCLVTGRNWFETYEIYKQLNLNTITICCNGCEIVNYQDNQFQSRYFTFHKKVAKIILTNPIFGNEMVWIILTTVDNVYRLNTTKEIDHFLKHDYTKAHHEVVYLRIKLRHKKFANLMFNNVKEVAPNLLIQCWEYPDRDIFFMEIGVSYATKKMGIEFLASYYNVDYKNIYVFGDNINDLSMLQLPCNTYALANAITQAKILARKITLDDNDNCGVARELKKIFLIK